MNRKIVVLAVALLAMAMLVTPLVSAKPGAEKNNEKFEYFYLLCSGYDPDVYVKEWLSPPEGQILIPNVFHGRGGGWVTGSTVELTVDEETFTTTTDPYSVGYTTTFDIEFFIDNEGNAKGYNIRLTDVVTVYDETVPIGTLVLEINAVLDLTTMEMSGTVLGYGTEELKGVHVSAVDLGMIDPGNLLYARVGTITGWPEEITNE